MELTQDENSFNKTQQSCFENFPSTFAPDIQNDLNDFPINNFECENQSFDESLSLDNQLPFLYDESMSPVLFLHDQNGVFQEALEGLPTPNTQYFPVQSVERQHEPMDTGNSLETLDAFDSIKDNFEEPVNKIFCKGLENDTLKTSNSEESNMSITDCNCEKLNQKCYDDFSQTVLDELDESVINEILNAIEANDNGCSNGGQNKNDSNEIFGNETISCPKDENLIVKSQNICRMGLVADTDQSTGNKILNYDDSLAELDKMDYSEMYFSGAPNQFDCSVVNNQTIGNTTFHDQVIQNMPCKGFVARSDQSAGIQISNNDDTSGELERTNSSESYFSGAQNHFDRSIVNNKTARNNTLCDEVSYGNLDMSNNRQLINSTRILCNVPAIDGNDINRDRSGALNVTVNDCENIITVFDDGSFIFGDIDKNSFATTPEESFKNSSSNDYIETTGSENNLYEFPLDNTDYYQTKSFYESFSFTNRLEEINEVSSGQYFYEDSQITKELKDTIKKLKKYDFEEAIEIFKFESWMEVGVTDKKVTQQIRRNMFRYAIREGKLMNAKKMTMWREFAKLVPENVISTLSVHTISTHWRQSIIKNGDEQAALYLAIVTNIDKNYAKIISSTSKINENDITDLLFINPLKEPDRYEEFRDKIRLIEKQKGLVKI